MDNEETETPQKVKSNFWMNIRKSGNHAENRSRNIGTPSKKQQFRSKHLQPRTPSGSGVCTSSSLAIVELMSNGSVVCTPPAKRFQKVRNPFEAALAERLHLPLIASPSLFQRPTTPQLSSTHFEWTIDEVSVLQPASVEPHETQFQDSPDPEFESKAQLAISSYFKEQQIVPSPVDCPLRSQRIILSEINANTPLGKPGRRIRDCATQTELTLPPVLPKELEDALRPYFRPSLAGVGYELNQKGTSYDAANNSMRRKLFDMHNIELLGSDDRPKTHSLIGSSPNSKNNVQQRVIAGKLSDSLDKSSFGSLSPISNLGGFSPNSPNLGSNKKRKQRLPNFALELEGAELLSPIQTQTSPKRRSLAVVSQSSYRCDINMSEHATLAELNGIDGNTEEDKNVPSANDSNFTPERSSSPMQMLHFSTDSSFNHRVSRLHVNSAISYSKDAAKKKVTGKVEMELFGPALHLDDTHDGLDDEEDDMQVSQLSSQSFNCSSSNSDTPRGKRRSANRKNLSQSFSTNWLDATDNDEDDQQPLRLAKTQVVTTANPVNKTADVVTDTKDVGYDKFNDGDKRQVFYRTDSGFNETSSTSGFVLSQEYQNSQPTVEKFGETLDVNMDCNLTSSLQTNTDS